MKRKTCVKLDSLKGIAGKLGVAPSSVSRALSGAKGVSPQLREKVLELAKSSGFSPDSLASSLRTGKPKGLVMIGSRNRSEVAALRDNLLFTKAKKIFGRVTAQVFSEGEDPAELIASAASTRPGALCLSNCNVRLPEELLESLSARGIPLLTIDCVSKGLDHIGVDRAAGTARMVRLFLLSGAKSPLFLSSTPFEAWNSDDRLVGIRRGLESLGLELRPEMIVALAPGLMGPAAGYEAASRILKSMFADAIFCYSDACAIGVMRALLKSGVRIPEDVRIAGFDNAPFAEFLPVSLSTVAQPVESLVDSALDLLRTRREDFSMPPRAMNMESTLVIRESAPITDHALREQIFKPL